MSGGRGPAEKATQRVHSTLLQRGQLAIQPTWLDLPTHLATPLPTLYPAVIYLLTRNLNHSFSVCISSVPLWRCSKSVGWAASRAVAQFVRFQSCHLGRRLPLWNHWVSTPLSSLCTEPIPLYKEHNLVEQDFKILFESIALSNIKDADLYILQVWMVGESPQLGVTNSPPSPVRSAAFGKLCREQQQLCRNEILISWMCGKESWLALFF